MEPDFEDFNAYVYCSTCGWLYDVVIWCLGPYVDDRVDHGVARQALARVTRCVVRWWYRLEEQA